jgi:hypothetical protein
MFIVRGDALSYPHSSVVTLPRREMGCWMGLLNFKMFPPLNSTLQGSIKRKFSFSKNSTHLQSVWAHCTLKYSFLHPPFLELVRISFFPRSLSEPFAFKASKFQLILLPKITPCFFLLSFIVFVEFVDSIEFVNL